MHGILIMDLKRTNFEAILILQKIFKINFTCLFIRFKKEIFLIIKLKLGMANVQIKLYKKKKNSIFLVLYSFTKL